MHLQEIESYTEICILGLGLVFSEEIRPVSENQVEVYDEILFLLREGASLEIRTEVVNPS